MSSLHARELFGQVGFVFHNLITDLASNVPRTPYHFMKQAKFEQLIKNSQDEGICVYWTELLSRAHWAANSNILRHKRWHDACLKLYSPEPNFLGFAACLRSLLEAAADASHSLSGVPLTLAREHIAIKEMLSGEAKSIGFSEELENMLIHFHYARKLGRGEAAPDSHKAATAATYLQTADGPNGSNMKELYGELCQFVHPAAQSVLWMADFSEETAILTGGDDKASIRELCSRHSAAINALHMQSINTCILILKVLNRFPIRELWTEHVNSINMERIKAWSKVKSEFDK